MGAQDDEIKIFPGSGPGDFFNRITGFYDDRNFYGGCQVPWALTSPSNTF